LVPGYPIRTPSDHSSVDSSPRLIAASHVLHRPLMPRHPPYALNNLTHNKTTQAQHKYQVVKGTTKKDQMLASTIQFSNTTPTDPHPNPPAPTTKPRPYGPHEPRPTKNNTPPTAGV